MNGIIAFIPKSDIYNPPKVGFSFLLHIFPGSMSLYPTLEDMEVSQMAATQHAAEQRLTQNAITAAGSGETMG